MTKELENILLKVLDLYNKYGVKSVTMDDVARELGISKKTLYQYVENKSDLVSKVIDYGLDQKDCSFKQIAEKKQNAIEELLEVGVYIVKSFKDYNPSLEYDLKKYYPDQFSKLNEVRKERMYSSILQNIQKGKSEGLFRTDMDEEIIAKIQVSRFLNFSSGDFLNSDEMLKPENILELFIYHIRGIANKKGLEVLDKTLEKIDIQEFLK